MRHHKQSGYSLLEVMLAITVIIALGALQLSDLRRSAENEQAKAVGDQLKTVGLALNTYISMQYGHIVNGTSVTGAGTASDPGERQCTAVTGGYDCTINRNALIGLGLVPPSFTGQNAYGSEYEYFIRVRGAAPDWRVSGMVRTISPYVVNGIIRYDLIGAAMYSAGSDSANVRADINTIDGLNGVWRTSVGDYPTGTLGQLAYRAGYGTSGFAHYVRLDGTVPMTGNLNLGGHDIQNAQNIRADGEVTAGRIATHTPRADAIVLGANHPTNRTIIGNNGNTLVIRNNGGLRIQGDAEPASLVAGDMNIKNLAAAGTGSFGGALQAKGITSTGGSNIHSSGQISSIGDFSTGNGSFRTANGSFVTTNGNISAINGTISAASLNITGDAQIGNNLAFNPNGAGWFYNSSSNSMTLGNNANLLVGGRLIAGTVMSNGNLEAHSLKINNAASEGSGCTPRNFVVDGTGRLLQCVNGVYKAAGGINNVYTVNAVSVAYAGGTSTATCGFGYKMISGGYIIEQRNSYNDPTAPGQSYGNPSGNSWVVVNPGDGNTAAFRAQAVCAN